MAAQGPEPQHAEWEVAETDAVSLVPCTAPEADGCGVAAAVPAHNNGTQDGEEQDERVPADVAAAPHVDTYEGMAATGPEAAAAAGPRASSPSVQEAPAAADAGPSSACAAAASGSGSAPSTSAPAPAPAVPSVQVVWQPAKEHMEEVLDAYRAFQSAVRSEDCIAFCTADVTARLPPGALLNELPARVRDEHVSRYLEHFVAVTQEDKRKCPQTGLFVPSLFMDTDSQSFYAC